MGPYARAGLAGIVSCGVLFTAVLIGRPDGNDDNAKDERPQPGPYVALGDSYTSGPKIPRQSGTPAGCDRSDHNYPAVVARQLGVTAADFRDVSCSGATITDLTAPQKTSNGTNPAQLSALSTRTRLVTLGIGGNDIGFGSTVTKCVTMGAMYRAIDNDRLFSDDAPCKKQYADNGTDEVAQKIQTAGRKLSAALAEIERRAPKAGSTSSAIRRSCPPKARAAAENCPSRLATRPTCTTRGSSSTPCCAGRARPPERRTSTPTPRPSVTTPAPLRRPAG